MMAEQSLRVLVVEDEALLRWSLAEILRRGGHTVLEAVSATTALEAMSSAPSAIDVVLLDYRLPDSNDLRLLEEIRSHRPGSAVVLMTAYATPEVVHEALERGAYCVISKPFDLHDVDTLIHNAHRANRPH